MPSFLKSDPEYGDPVVIIPHKPVPYIKRLIGKPGDVIRIVDKKLYVNGKLLEREYIDSEDITLQRRIKYSPDGEIFTKRLRLRVSCIMNIMAIQNI